VSFLQTMNMVTWLVTAGSPAAPGTETREGYVLPAGCTSSRESTKAAHDHTTKCALELECVVTGYGLLADGKFFEFDDEGDQKALKYFRQTVKTEDHLVKVTGDFTGEEVVVKAFDPVTP